MILQSKIDNSIGLSITSSISKFSTFSDFENWYLTEVEEAIKNKRLNRSKINTLIDLAYLLGYESKSDKSIESNIALKLRNRLLTSHQKYILDKYFYSNKNYSNKINLEEIKNVLHKALSKLFMESKDVILLSRVKEYMSLISKIINVYYKKFKSKDIKILLEKIYQLGTNVSKPPNEFGSMKYIDDLIGFYLIIDDSRLNDTQRKKKLTEIITKLELFIPSIEYFEKFILERKRSRVIGFESANIYIYGPINHRNFGYLPIKIQIRFKKCMYQESAMYYVYKRFGEWQMPLWYSDIDFNSYKNFREIQSKLFYNLKNYVFNDK